MSCKMVSMNNNIDLRSQPVSELQLNQLVVEWVSHDEVKPNRYNPNRMTWHERMLLRQSMLEDGWTQPVVTLPDGTIVDGEQRWTVAGQELAPSDVQKIIDKMETRQSEGHDISESILWRLHESKERLEAAIEQGFEPTLASITGGKIPITRLDLGDDAHKIISTIRHNRARGMHQIDAMADLTQDLVQLGLDFDDLETRLGMDNEEIERMLKSADDILSLMEDELQGEYSQSWSPEHVSQLVEDEVAARHIERSREAAEEAKEYQMALAERKRAIDRAKKEQVEALEADGKTLTQEEKASIEAELEAKHPVPEAPAPPQMKKIILFFSVDEYEMIVSVLGDERATNLVRICRTILAHEDEWQRWWEEA